MAFSEGLLPDADRQKATSILPFDGIFLRRDLPHFYRRY